MRASGKFFVVSLRSCGCLDLQTLECMAKAVGGTLTGFERLSHFELGSSQGMVGSPRAGDSLEIGCLEDHAGEVFRGDQADTLFRRRSASGFVGDGGCGCLAAHFLAFWRWLNEL